MSLPAPNRTMVVETYLFFRCNQMPSHGRHWVGMCEFVVGSWERRLAACSCNPSSLLHTVSTEAARPGGRAFSEPGWPVPLSEPASAANAAVTALVAQPHSWSACWPPGNESLTVNYSSAVFRFSLIIPVRFYRTWAHAPRGLDPRPAAPCREVAGIRPNTQTLPSTSGAERSPLYGS